MRFGDEGLLLALLNSAPTDGGNQHDQLGDFDDGRAWLERQGQTSSAEALRLVKEARKDLWAVIRGEKRTETLMPYLVATSAVPEISGGRLVWRLKGPAEQMPGALAVLTWLELDASAPGRVRPCQNPECTLFLIDHSKSNSARWCSMAVCGNRMKARRHHERSRAREDAGRE